MKGLLLLRGLYVRKDFDADDFFKEEEESKQKASLCSGCSRPLAVSLCINRSIISA